MDVTELHDEENLLLRQTLGMGCMQSTTARNTDINGIKLSNDETEETKNQVFGNIPSLLVCLSGLSGGWSSEIPDIGGLFRLVCFGRSCVAAISYSTDMCSLQIHQRINNVVWKRPKR